VQAKPNSFAWTFGFLGLPEAEVIPRRRFTLHHVQTASSALLSFWDAEASIQKMQTA
jgi:hypothetical protein